MPWSSVVPRGSAPHGVLLFAVRDVRLAAKSTADALAEPDAGAPPPKDLPADGHVHVRIGSRIWTAGRRAPGEPWDDVFAAELCLHQRMFWTMQVDVFGSRGLLRRHAHLGRADVRLARVPPGPDQAPAWFVLRTKLHAYAGLVDLGLPHVVAADAAHRRGHVLLALAYVPHADAPAGRGGAPPAVQRWLRGLGPGARAMHHVDVAQRGASAALSPAALDSIDSLAARAPSDDAGGRASPDRVLECARSQSSGERSLPDQDDDVAAAESAWQRALSHSVADLADLGIADEQSLAFSEKQRSASADVATLGGRSSVGRERPRSGLDDVPTLGERSSVTTDGDRSVSADVAMLGENASLGHERQRNGLGDAATLGERSSVDHERQRNALGDAAMLEEKASVGHERQRNGSHGVAMLGEKPPAMNEKRQAASSHASVLSEKSSALEVNPRSTSGSHFAHGSNARLDHIAEESDTESAPRNETSDDANSNGSAHAAGQPDKVTVNSAPSDSPGSSGGAKSPYAVDMPKAANAQLNNIDSTGDGAFPKTWKSIFRRTEACREGPAQRSASLPDVRTDAPLDAKATDRSAPDAASARSAAHTESGASRLSAQLRSSARETCTIDESSEIGSVVKRLSGWVLGEEDRRAVETVLNSLSGFGTGVEVGRMSMLAAYFVLQRFHRRLPVQYSNNIVLGKADMQVPRAVFRHAFAACGWTALTFFGKRSEVFADALSTKANRRAVVDYLEIRPEDMLVCDLDTQVDFRPAFFVAHDRRLAAIVLSIRGTMSLRDTLTDLTCEYVPWRGGLAHSGMLGAARWFLRNVGRQLLLFAEDRGAGRLIVTGHSLGGACAALMTIMLDELVRTLASGAAPSDDLAADMGVHRSLSPTIGSDLLSLPSSSVQSSLLFAAMSDDARSESTISGAKTGFKEQLLERSSAASLSHTSPPASPTDSLLSNLSIREVRADGLHVHCYAYGTPAVLSPNIADDYNDLIDSFVLADDIVPRLCYGTALDLQAQIVHCAQAASATDLFVPLANTHLGAKIALCRYAVLASRTNMPLYVPGRVHHLLAFAAPSGRRYTVPDTCGSERFGEISLRPGMLIDHFPHRYEQALEDTYVTFLMHELEERQAGSPVGPAPLTQKMRAVVESINRSQAESSSSDATIQIVPEHSGAFFPRAEARHR